MTAVPIIELDRFYFHFKSLLFSGFKASLVVNSDNGEASVTLSAGLGSLNNCKVVKNKKKRSPSYLRRLAKRKNERNDAANEETAEKVVTSENVAAATDAETPPQSLAEEALNTGEDTICDDDIIENEAVEATSEESADKQAEAVEKRRFWLCIYHGCIDNTTLEDLECSCCGIECQVVEYDSEVEYEPD